MTDYQQLFAEAERRRVNTLLMIVAAMAAFVWLELGRRLGLAQRLSDERDNRIDLQISTLTADQLGHAGRTQGVSSVFKAAATVLSTFAVLIAIFVPLIATHTL